MRILFLHLSDAHILETTNISQLNPLSIARSLQELQLFDECIVVFSGDIAHSGTVNEYKVAQRFLGNLIVNIKKLYFDENHHLPVIVVPGNHDGVFSASRIRDDIVASYSSKSVELDYKKELQSLSNFFELSERNRCFVHNKSLDIRIEEVGDIRIRFNLINTAPFSLLHSDNGDKGLHYLPQEELNSLYQDMNADFTVSVMHHAPEWFSDNAKRELLNAIQSKSDILFVGHEHFSQNENKIINGEQSLDISTGIALFGTRTEHGYNAIILDTSERTLLGYKYIYEKSIYRKEENPILRNEHVLFKGRKFVHTRAFSEFLTSDEEQKAGQNYLDYFVFPWLESQSVNDEMKNYRVGDYEKFLSLMNTKKILSIEGGTRTGKSILAKYLCYRLVEKFVPLYLKDTDFATPDDSKIIRTAFESQYMSFSSYDAFKQSPVDNLVLIVDRYDRVPKSRWDNFLKGQKDKFGHIILFCNIGFNINLKEKAIEELTSNETFYLSICPFYYGKRAELIDKICTISENEWSPHDKAEMVTRINDDITNQLRYFQLTPDFIHQYVTYYLHFPYIRTQNDTNVFNKVFEGNITFRIKNHTTDDNVSEILVALDYVAHKIHFEKSYPLKIEAFETAIEEYNQDYDNEVKPKVVYNVALAANIIKESADGFEIAFADENLLAYFVANHLNRKFNEGRGADELKYILDNICFGINGDIILFLSYITSNVQILGPIIDSIINHMGTWQELDIDAKNITYLTAPMKPVRVNLPTVKDKEQHKKDKTEMEKEYVERRQKENNIESLYSYNEEMVNSFENKINKSFNYLSLVAKILPNFRHILSGPQKAQITEILYTYPNKLLYLMLKDIDKNYSEIVEDIMKNNPRTKRGLLITKDMFIKCLRNQSIAYILSIYDFIASSAVSSKSIKDLNEKFDYTQNTNYMIQNVMMEENGTNFSRLAEKAEKIYNKTNLEMVRFMLKAIMRKHFLTHDFDFSPEVQHTISVFFTTEQQAELRKIQIKNHFTKK